MTLLEAKITLLRYRAGGDDPGDPEVAQALALARQDPTLQQWLAREQECQGAIRAKMRGIRVPADLKDRILAAPKVSRPQFRRSNTLLATAAAFTILFAAAALVWTSRDAGPRFAQFQSRMVSTVLRQYRMDVASEDMAAVRDHMVKNGAPADYLLTRGLEGVPLAGGGFLRWQNQPVSMLCFYRKQTPQDTEMIYLFVLRASGLKDPPPPTPRVGQMSGMTTVTWTAGENVYLLTGPEEPGFAEKYR